MIENPEDLSREDKVRAVLALYATRNDMSSAAMAMATSPEPDIAADAMVALSAAFRLSMKRAKITPTMLAEDKGELAKKLGVVMSAVITEIVGDMLGARAVVRVKQVKSVNLDRWME